MAMILRSCPGGYDRNTVMQVIQKYHNILLMMKGGKISAEAAAEELEKVKSTPIPAAAEGFVPQEVEDYLGLLEKELKRYKASELLSISKVKGGYTMASFNAKADAYNDLIFAVNEGMDRASALLRLESIRQMTPESEKSGFFGKKGFEQTAADAYLADIDAYVSGLL